jgi:uncharacterized membrane protein
MEQNRWKSIVLWEALAAQIISILILLKVIDTGMGEIVNQVVAGVLQILTLVGVINNPKDPIKW